MHSGCCHWQSPVEHGQFETIDDDVTVQSVQVAEELFNWVNFVFFLGGSILVLLHLRVSKQCALFIYIFLVIISFTIDDIWSVRLVSYMRGISVFCICFSKNKQYRDLFIYAGLGC
jgi:hypothetical protein